MHNSGSQSHNIQITDHKNDKNSNYDNDGGDDDDSDDGPDNDDNDDVFVISIWNFHNTFPNNRWINAASFFQSLPSPVRDICLLRSRRSLALDTVACRKKSYANLENNAAECQIKAMYSK